MTEYFDSEQYPFPSSLSSDPISDDEAYEQETYFFSGDEEHTGDDQESCEEGGLDDDEVVSLGEDDSVLAAPYVEAPEKKAENLAQVNRMLAAQKKMIVALLQIPYALKIMHKWYSGVADGSIAFTHVIVRGEAFKKLNIPDDEQLTAYDVRPLCRCIGDACAALLDCQSVGGHGKQEQDFIDRLKETIADQMVDVYFKKKDWCKLNRAIDKSALPTKYTKPYESLKEALADIKGVENYFVTTNKRFVYSIALKMNPTNDKVWDTDDRAQAGNDGLLMALEKWFPERGSFLTYAKRWIIQRIKRAQEDEGPSIRISNHLLKSYGRYCKIFFGSAIKRGVCLAPEEVGAVMNAEGCGVSKDALAILAHMPQTIYMSKSADDDRPLEFACDKIKSPFDVLYAKESKKILAKVMVCLTPDEASIVALHYGLPDPLHPDAPVQEYTPKEIGQMHGGMTCDQVKQIKEMAVRKMMRHGKKAFPHYEL